MEKIIKKGVLIKELEHQVFTGSIESVISNLKDVKDRYETEESYSNLTLQTSYGYDWFEIELRGDRLETDVELEVRRRKAREDAAREEENKRKRYLQYKRLKEEFDGE